MEKQTFRGADKVEFNLENHNKNNSLSGLVENNKPSSLIESQDNSRKVEVESVDFSTLFTSEMEQGFSTVSDADLKNVQIYNDNNSGEIL